MVEIGVNNFVPLITLKFAYPMYDQNIFSSSSEFGKSIAKHDVMYYEN